jgi:hypothetical protein
VGLALIPDSCTFEGEQRGSDVNGLLPKSNIESCQKRELQIILTTAKNPWKGLLMMGQQSDLQAELFYKGAKGLRPTSPTTFDAETDEFAVVTRKL